VQAALDMCSACTCTASAAATLLVESEWLLTFKNGDSQVCACVCLLFQEMNDKEATLMRLEGELRATESELTNRSAPNAAPDTGATVCMRIMS
jgi:hypothetical protein